MESKPIKQAVALVLDTRGMEGPVTRREIAEGVMRLAGPDSWSQADTYDAKLAYIQREVVLQMGEAHSSEFIERHLGLVPAKYQPVLRTIPRYICVSSKGGRGSEHIMAFVATREHWEANFALKDQIVQATRVSRDASRDICDLLEGAGIDCLADLLGRKQAA